jgi:tetratricopeptide (TPR) repeat protein
VKLEITSIFIVYLILFRLSIIAAGIISIFLGYRLFVRGIGPVADTAAGTDISARIARTRFSVKNAAPGTCFALFGVVTISIMFARGGPELTLKSIQNAANTGLKTSELRLRGDGQSGLKAASLKGEAFERQQDIDKAIIAYEEALLLMARPMNNLAWHYQRRGKIAEALPIARLAVTLAPNDPDHLDTLAEILVKKGEAEEAVKLWEKAAEIDSKYLKKIEQMDSTNKSGG